MNSSLRTSASGMIAQQRMIDVLANNLANVNTTGFKRSRVSFEDVLYETVQGTRVVNYAGAKCVFVETLESNGFGVTAERDFFSHSVSWVTRSRPSRPCPRGHSEAYATPTLRTSRVQGTHSPLRTRPDGRVLPR